MRSPPHPEACSQGGAKWTPGGVARASPGHLGMRRRWVWRPAMALGLLALCVLPLAPCSGAYGEDQASSGSEEENEGGSDGPGKESDDVRREDPPVPYRRSRASREGWETPFMRPLRISTTHLADKCAHLAPGFDPQVVRQRDSWPRFTTIQQLRDLAEGHGGDQKVLVVAPRFGLGNTLRNWVSAFYWGLFSGRRIVLLHGGKYHGVYTSLCDAFDCAFDHIQAPALSSEGKGRHKEAEELLEELEHHIDHRQVSQRVARDALFWDDPIVFSFSYAFWDHWWLNNRSLAFCGCHAVGGCKYGGGVRSKALHALISGGPSEALGETIESVLRRHEPKPSRILLLPRTQGHTGEGEDDEKEGERGDDTASNPGAAAVAAVALRAEELQPASSGVAMQFDVGFHIRTRTSVLENPNRPFGSCKGDECEDKREEELRKFRERFLGSKTWKCIGLFLRTIAGLHGPDRVRPLSIFLATDNQVLRPAFVKRLARYGVVYYNGADVAHVGVSASKDKGRLPTMAEFYLLGKSHVIVELDSYLSTFSYFSGLMGNGTIVTLPYIVKDLQRCSRTKAVQKGLWRKGDPRASSNNLFSIRP